MRTKELILEIICCLIIILFLYTGISKTIDRQAFEFDLINAPIIKKIAPVVYAGLPAVEILTAIALMFRKTRKIALYASTILMVIFTLYVTGVMTLAKNRPCTCGGILRSMSWSTHLIFNITFTIIAAAGVYVSHKNVIDNYNSKRAATNFDKCSIDNIQ